MFRPSPPRDRLLDNLRIDPGAGPEIEDDIPDMPPNSTGSNRIHTYATQSDRDSATMTVPKDVAVRGKLAGVKAVVVHGTLSPDVEGLENLTVAPGGIVLGGETGEIEVLKDADIEGYVEAHLTVLGTLRVRATGHVKGAVAYGRLAIDEGGEIVGPVKAYKGEDDESVRSDDPQHHQSDVEADGNAGA